MNLKGYETDGVPAPSDFELAEAAHRPVSMKCLTCGGERVVETYAEKLNEDVFVCRDCLDTFTEGEAKLTAYYHALEGEISRRNEIIRRLRDICHWLTPAIVYNLLGDDAVVALGWPLRIDQFKGDTSALIDLSWSDPDREQHRNG